MTKIFIDGQERSMTSAEEADLASIRNAIQASISSSVTTYQAVIQAIVDETARSKQFNDGVTLASYVNSTVAAWSAQAVVFVAWRDAIWQYAYAELAKVQAGTRPQPTLPDFLSELPVIDWPDA